jgi:drug/metabolite transporter, DME family
MQGPGPEIALRNEDPDKIVSSMAKSPLRYRLMLVAAAALFSTGGAAIKAASLNGLQIASFRSGVAAVFLLAAIPESRRQWRWPMAPVAACYAATLVAFVMANRLTTAANAIFLQSTAPLYVLLLGPLFLHERIRPRDVGFVAVVLCGIACFFVGAPAVAVTAPDPWRGNLFGLASGVTYAFTLAGLRLLARRDTGGAAIATVALGNLMACAATLPWALPVHAPRATDAAVLLYLGTIQIGTAYVFLTRGIRHIPAVEATTLLMAEPALNPVWTWLVHREAPGIWAIAGGALIVTATLWNTWRGQRYPL